jgi:predicted transcriptional regulator
VYRESQADDFLFDSNREALHKLASIYVRLLIPQRNITTMSTEANEKALQAQIDQIKKDLAGNIPSTLRESKQATLNICVQRLSNLRRRFESLAEIESDLTRIEAQIDLALEDASLKGKPTAISGNIDLVSHLLIDDTSATTTSSSGQILEN